MLIIMYNKTAIVLMHGVFPIHPLTLSFISPTPIHSHSPSLIQDTLLFSVVNNGNGGGLKEESKHVFLFDHLILVTHTADSDGFFDYLMGIKVRSTRSRKCV